MTKRSTASANVLRAAEEIRQICALRRVEICGDFAIHEIDSEDASRSLLELRSIEADGFTQSPRISRP